MKRANIFILLLLLTGFVCGAVKIVPFPDIYIPIMIEIDDQNIYISEKATIYIYSLSDFKFKKKFGGPGEGPQEFKGYALMILMPDQIVINSTGKISFFKKDGAYIKEKQAKTEGGNYRPIGNNFVGYSFKVMRSKEDKLSYKTVNIYNADLEKQKEIFSQELDWQEGKGTKLFHTSFTYHIADDKIFLAGTPDFNIDVYNSEGNKLYSINQDYKRIAFTNTHKEEFLKDKQRDPRIKDNFAEWKTQVIFPGSFPAIKYFLLADKKIYIQTWKTEGNQYEFYIMDFDGKLLKKTFLPLVDRSYLVSFPFTIKNNKLYQLVENTENEGMELHIHDIE